MPFVTIAYAGAPTKNARTRLISRITEAVTAEFSVPAAAVNVILTPVRPDSWGVAGQTLESVLQSEAGPTSPRSSLIPRHVYVMSRGLRLHALDFEGEAPAVVIIPGITSPAATWEFVVAALDLPNRVLVTDCRGRGLSDAPATSYTLDDYAADLSAWITEFGMQNPILLGHSLGARIAARYSAKTSRCQLIAVEPPLSGPARPYPISLDYFLEGLSSMQSAPDIAALRLQYPGWNDARIRDRVRWLPTCSCSAIRETYEHFHDELFLPDWGQGVGPALFIRGERSPVVHVGDLTEIAAARPSAEFATIAAAGHMVPWDALEAFVGCIRPCIAKWSAVMPERSEE